MNVVVGRMYLVKTAVKHSDGNAIKLSWLKSNRVGSVLCSHRKHNGGSVQSRRYNRLAQHGDA